jgi:hypothetical protein
VWQEIESWRLSSQADLRRETLQEPLPIGWADQKIHVVHRTLVQLEDVPQHRRALQDDDRNSGGIRSREYGAQARQLPQAVRGDSGVAGGLSDHEIEYRSSE